MQQCIHTEKYLLINYIYYKSTVVQENVVLLLIKKGEKDKIRKKGKNKCNRRSAVVHIKRKSYFILESLCNIRPDDGGTW